MSLTKKQRRLRKEIENIASLATWDHWNIERYAEENRTTLLELLRSKLVRGEVIMKYTFIDDLLGQIICNIYFTVPHTSEHWRGRQFRLFNHYILDELFLLKKLAFVNAVKKIPKELNSSICAINDLRNAVGHSLFPENRRQHMPVKKVQYKGKDIFSLEGVQQLLDDCRAVESYLFRRAFPEITAHRQGHRGQPGRRGDLMDGVEKPSS